MKTVIGLVILILFVLLWLANCEDKRQKKYAVSDRAVDEESLKANAIRRRPTQQQGHALVVLGHAIEYLIDSYVVIASADGGRSDAEAVQILTRLSREVFADCEEIIPIGKRITDAIRGSIRRLREPAVDE